ncbi:MAG: O-antigen ligase family protein [Nitrospira sp.]|nr:MAG: O-antigen ligase family protein [Nitrospira sp.]
MSPRISRRRSRFRTPFIDMAIYRQAIIVLSAAFGFAQAGTFFDVTHIQWATGLFILALPVLFKAIRGSDVLHSPVMLWCYGFIWFSFAWFFLSSQSEVAWADVRLRCFGVLLIVSFLMVFWDPDAVRFARYAVAACVIFGVVVNVYELFVPKAFSKLPGRSAGFYGDPNMSAEMLVLGMIVSVTLLPSRWRGLFVLTTGIGVGLTISRSGILSWLIASAALMALRKVRVQELLVTGLVVMTVVALGFIARGDELLTTLQRSGTINKDVLERLDWFADPTGVSDNSSWARRGLVIQAWDKIAERPWFGNGTGTSREVVYEGTHNQYLAHMQDHGLLGMMIVPLLTLAVAWRASGEARLLAAIFGAVVIWQGFFTHNILDHPPRLLLCALMAAIVWISRTSAIDHSLSVPTGA